MPGCAVHWKRSEYVLVGGIAAFFAFVSAVGVTWGLPSRRIDRYLFADQPPWPGEKIYRLAGGAAKFTPDRGADVDIDPVRRPDGKPISLTASDEDIARVYLRYRLYTYQPDEMITMMALAGMNPRSLDFDPRLYQYGGLFVYPVGALIGASGLFGLIDVRSDVTYYLDSPDEFGKFYIVARAYAAAWGLIGVLCVYAIGRRLGGVGAGWLAALLFTLMPVVICMAHEGKPHLPGAALMLLSVLLAMRAVEEGPARGTRRYWWLMCICCGAAFAMVLSSWPILVLVPLVAVRAAGVHGVAQGDVVPSARRHMAAAIRGTVQGLMIAAGTYLIANPYIVINAFVNRQVLRSNFGNSLAMYEVSRLGEGFIRVIELTIEGVALPVAIAGVLALAGALLRRSVLTLPLAIPAILFFVQFVLIGAGKPGEYGRFGIFPNAALAIGTSCLLARRWPRVPPALNYAVSALVLAGTAFHGAEYLCNFRIDAAGRGSRIRMAEAISERCCGPRQGGSSNEPGRSLSGVAVTAEPAPYSCPPLPFNRVAVNLLSDVQEFQEFPRSEREGMLLIRAVDRTAPQSHRPSYIGHFHPVAVAALLWDPAAPYGPPETQISWANKPFRKHGEEVREVFDGPADSP